MEEWMDSQLGKWRILPEFLIFNSLHKPYSDVVISLNFVLSSLNQLDTQSLMGRSTQIEENVRITWSKPSLHRCEDQDPRRKVIFPDSSSVSSQCQDCVRVL